MVTLIALPINSRETIELGEGLVWAQGRFRASEAGTKLEKRSESELPPIARKFVQDKNRKFSCSKHGPNNIDEVIFEFIISPIELDALESVLLIWINDSSIFSAYELHEISQLQKKGRDLLRRIKVNVDLISLFSRAIVVTTDDTIDIKKSYSLYKFEDKEFLLKHRLADVIVLTVMQESSTYLLEKLAAQGFGFYRKGSRYLRILEFVDSQIWWNQLSNSKAIKKFLFQHREKNGIQERNNQLKEIGKRLLDEKALREQRITNFLVVALAAISIWATLSK